MLGNCACPSWLTSCPTPKMAPQARIASDQYNGHLINANHRDANHRDANQRYATHTDANLSGATYRQAMMDQSTSNPDWIGLSKSDADACVTQVDFGYRKLTNGYLIEYTFDDAYDFDATINKMAPSSVRDKMEPETDEGPYSNLEVPLPNSVTLFLRSYDKKARVFVEKILLSVSYYRQNFEKDETPLEWRSASIREYQYPDEKGNPVLDTTRRLVLEKIDGANVTDARLEDAKSGAKTDEIISHGDYETLPRTFKVDQPMRQPRDEKINATES